MVWVISKLIQFGGSPRAHKHGACSQSLRLLEHRAYVIPEDVRAVCMDVMRHRIGITYEAEAENITQEQIITEILNRVEVP